MTTLDVQADRITVRFTTAERLAGLVRDAEVPRAAVRSVEVVPDGLRAVRGLRAPGLGLPGLRAVGTWRSRGGRTLVSVRRGRPALRVVLEGQRWTALLLDVADAEATAQALRP